MATDVTDTASEVIARLKAMDRANVGRSASDDEMISMVVESAIEVIEALRASLSECSDDLAAEIDARFAGALHYPVEARRHARDMAPVRRARGLLSD